MDARVNIVDDLVQPIPEFCSRVRAVRATRWTLPSRILSHRVLFSVTSDIFAIRILS